MSDNKFKLPPEIEKLKAAGAHMEGITEAIPIIRSMYPSISRGQMAEKFGESYSRGFDQGYQAAITMAEEILLRALKHSIMDQKALAEQIKMQQMGRQLDILTEYAYSETISHARWRESAIAEWNEKVGRK